jgi:signal transduction histidine kinase
MAAPSRMPDSLRIASALSPVLFALGDPDLLVELLSSSPAGVVLVEASHDLPVVYCNEAFQRWAPLGRLPVVGRSLPDLFAWSDRAAIRAGYREVIRTGCPLHWRSAPYHERSGPADRVAYWNVSHYPLRVPAGRVTHVMSFTVDVTDQAGARARMNEAQQRVLSALGGIARHLSEHGELQAFFQELSATIADLVSAARVAFLLYDPDSQTVSPQPGGFGFATDELERLRGIPCRPGRDGMVERVVFGNQVIREHVDLDDPRLAPYRSLISAAGAHDVISIPWHAGEHRLGAVGVCDSTRRSGFSDEDVWVLQVAAAAAGLVWQHRQADEALAELREQEAAGLRQQIDHSLQLEQLKADFLELASHELRGPLGVVRGYVSMMEDGTLGPVGERVDPVLPVLRTKLDEMNRLINDMLETARLDDSALQLELGRVDLREVVNEAVRSLEPLADERHSLVTSIPGGPVVVMGDRSRLTMIVTNLVHNAIKYSPAGGEVRVACGADGDGARVAVSDQGIGIAQASFSRLFTRFGRIVTEETAAITGTGLGLYLAREMASRHGGGVEVESEPGRGTTFTLTLPLSADQ